MIFWSASFTGAKAVPGTYRAILTVNGKKQSQNFEILINPLAEATLSDIQAQFEFVNQVNKTADEAHQSIRKIRALNKKLTAFEENFKEDPKASDLNERSKKLRHELSSVEKALYQTQNRSNQDPLNFPIRLTNKLGHLNRLVTLNDFSPTDQDQAVRKELTQAIRAQLDIFNRLVATEVKSFNAAYKELELDYLVE